MSNHTKKTPGSEYAPKWARQNADEPSDEPDREIADGEGDQELAVPEYLRRLQPEIVPAPRRLGRRLSFSSIAVATLIGAAIGMAGINAPKWITALGLGTNSVDSTLKRGGHSSRSAEYAPQPAFGGVSAGGATTTTRTAALEPALAVQV